MGMEVPLLDSTRAREQLGWTPRSDSAQALLEVLDGIRRSAGMDTPPLAPGAGGRLRLRELTTGVGGRSP